MGYLRVLKINIKSEIFLIVLNRRKKRVKEVFRIEEKIIFLRFGF